MISMIEGEVRALREGYCIIMVQGIGYRVAATKETLNLLSKSSRASLWTHLTVREDALDLYGFLSEEEMRFFTLLLTVSGIGPKSALGILDIAPAESLKSAIAGGNIAHLTSVSGIGKKTAEKIVLELKDKVRVEAGARSNSGDVEALEAMRALGYSAIEAREALRKVPGEIEGSSQRLREALRLMSSHS